MESKVKWVRLGDYIERIDERNSDNLVKVVKSVSVFKEFRDTGAKVDKNDLHNYKIVWPGDISFVQTTGNEKCLAAALSEFSYPIVVTSVNEVLRTKRDYLLPEYLMLYFLRKETDRYARYNSWGSARETFKWDDMCNISIPLPSLPYPSASHPHRGVHGPRPRDARGNARIPPPSGRPRCAG